eukprot:gb/GEZN01003887.1/.p1 GENE.gb/GEZN01003887.1/~~gb/GEZN01003887.1/.p1  ORF type:complete len:549 (+),score=68.89 gb/GEZN01003887.1/:139-1785(+)
MYLVIVALAGLCFLDERTILVRGTLLWPKPIPESRREETLANGERIEQAAQYGGEHVRGTLLWPKPTPESRMEATLANGERIEQASQYGGEQQLLQQQSSQYGGEQQLLQQQLLLQQRYVAEGYQKTYQGNNKDGNNNNNNNNNNNYVYDTTAYCSGNKRGLHTAQGSYDKIFTIWFENHGYKDVIANSYWAEIIANSYSLSSYFGVTYPSQPNYVAFLGGTYSNCTNDDQCYLTNTNLIDLLEQRGLSWRGYAENYVPNSDGSCNTANEIKGYDAFGTQSAYVRKHNPFMAWSTITEDADRCKYLGNETNFFNDVKNNNLPNFGMYTPNLNDDSHDTDLDYSGKFLQGWLDDSFYAYPNSWHNVLLFVTFQADDKSEHNHVPAFILTASNHKYFKSAELAGKDDTGVNVIDTNTSHYSMLKLIEDNFGLGTLGQNDVKANAIVLPGQTENSKENQQGIIIPTWGVALAGAAVGLICLRLCYKCGANQLKDQPFTYPGYPVYPRDELESGLEYNVENDSTSSVATYVPSTNSVYEALGSGAGVFPGVN